MDEEKKKVRAEEKLGGLEAGEEDEEERNEKMDFLHTRTNNVAGLIRSNFLMDKRCKGTSIRPVLTSREWSLHGTLR
jgi:hypothetical protein